MLKHTGIKVVFIEKKNTENLNFKPGGRNYTLHKLWTQHCPKCAWWKYDPQNSLWEFTHRVKPTQRILHVLHSFGEICNTNSIVERHRNAAVKRKKYSVVWPHVFHTSPNKETLLINNYVCPTLWEVVLSFFTSLNILLKRQEITILTSSCKNIVSARYWSPVSFFHRGSCLPSPCLSCMGTNAIPQRCCSIFYSSHSRALQQNAE